jgi:hypothetical protein
LEKIVERRRKRKEGKNKKQKTTKTKKQNKTNKIARIKPPPSPLPLCLLSLCKRHRELSENSVTNFHGDIVKNYPRSYLVLSIKSLFQFICDGL